MHVSGLFGPRQTSPPSWQSSQCVWDGGFSHFPPAQQRSSKETLALCVFRCQRLNTGSFFSPLYGRLYSNLILNHTDTPCYTPFSGLLAWLYWWWTVKKKKNKGGVTAFRDYCLALKLFFSSFFSENIPVKCFLSQINLQYCAHGYVCHHPIAAYLLCNKDWFLSRCRRQRSLRGTALFSGAISSSGTNTETLQGFLWHPVWIKYCYTFYTKTTYITVHYNHVALSETPSMLCLMLLI